MGNSTFGTMDAALRALGRAFLDREMAKTPAEVAADKREWKRRMKKVTITVADLERYQRDSLELGVWRVWREPPNYNRHGELLNHPTNDTRKLCRVISGGGKICSSCGRK